MDKNKNTESQEPVDEGKGEIEENKESPQEQVDLISRANEAAAKLKEVNDAISKLEEENSRHMELIKKVEQLNAKKLLGGKTEAGGEKKEETPQEYTKRIMRGDVDGRGSA